MARPRTRHPGPRLRSFRKGRDLALREAARQLHVVHPALKDWEEGNQTPTAPYREAIEVWTNGEIKASDWPLTGRELQIANQARLVKPVSDPDAPNGSQPSKSARRSG